ncbi:unnamed protein product [Callosobruchus maculatus]|uniref:THAP-type domain-containing protein n=1 Tax=Callosobruchus maculatus TaxID=64391 RepID=A0A653CGI9_CALMS|nr:unnamed protein product [Callosobruchus maculatus]
MVSLDKKDTERNLTFHRLPEVNARQVYIENEMGKHLMDQRKAWILKLKIGKQVSESVKVCSLHFNKGTSSDQTDRYKRRDRGTCTSKNEDPQECDFEANVQATANLVQLLRSTPDISEKDLDSAFLQNRKVQDSVSDVLKTNAAPKSFTGINNFQIVDCVVNMINEFCIID